jgi:hypothetical protein
MSPTGKRTIGGGGGWWWLGGAGWWWVLVVGGLFLLPVIDLVTLFTPVFNICSTFRQGKQIDSNVARLLGRERSHVDGKCSFFLFSSI